MLTGVEHITISKSTGQTIALFMLFLCSLASEFEFKIFFKICVKYFIYEDSPFHPKIIDPTKVEVVDCPEYWTAADRLTVIVDQLHNIVFDCSGAGPGLCLRH